MTATSYSTADVEVVKHWSSRALNDTISDETMIGQMLSDGSLMRDDKLNSNAGDQTKYHLRKRLQTAGFRGDEAATGNEKALTYAQDTINIDHLREATQIPNEGTISAQRVTFNLPEDSYQVLKDWMVERQTIGLFNQLAGYSATSLVWDGVTLTGDDRLKFTGLNAVRTPTSARTVRPNSLTTDEAVNADTTATFKLSLIQEAEKIAMKDRAPAYIQPLSGLRDGAKFRCYVHVDQYYQIINDTTAPHQYRDIILAQIGGGSKKEALIGRSIVFSQTEIIATDKIPYGVHSSTSASQTNVRRAVFVGKNAGCIAFGKGFSNGKSTVPGFKFRQDMVDIEHWIRHAIVCTFGIVKSQYESADNAVVTIPTYVA